MDNKTQFQNFFILTFEDEFYEQLTAIAKNIIEELNIELEQHKTQKTMSNKQKLMIYGETLKSDTFKATVKELKIKHNLTKQKLKLFLFIDKHRQHFFITTYEQYLHNSIKQEQIENYKEPNLMMREKYFNALLDKNLNTNEEGNKLLNTNENETITYNEKSN